MLDSEKKTAASICRRPKASTVINRRQMAHSEQKQMLATKKEVVIPRPSQMAADGPMTKMSAQPMQANAAKQPVQHSMMQQTQRRMVQGIQRPAMKQPAQPEKQPTAKEIKDAAIQKALTNAARNKTEKKNATHVHFGFKRVVLAMACAAAAVFAIVYFVNLNAPNVSLKVAAMQTGIEATYPSYIPRDYSLSDITSENGKITLNFKNGSTGDAFSLVEETSSWDSNALLKNFVRGEYGENYTTIREQGLTLYVSGSNAAWVNGGIVYKLTTTSGSLTKKQIKTIAVSL